MGAIWCIFWQLSGSNPDVPDAMQPARNLFAAGYALYGVYTVLMCSAGYGVQWFVLDKSFKEYILTNANVIIPFLVLSTTNEGQTSESDSKAQEMLKCLKA
ncbi:Fructose-1-6-bisphosphatase [Gracilaria domingensis]|nr:Fructose-1-6-bisphosphatase [Gracilaria domingensis]